jgi:hypothetical protein
MANAYRVVTVDLTNARDRGEIIPRDVGVTNILILTLSAGAAISLHVGEREAIPVPGAGFTLDDLCPPENKGIFLTHLAQPGLTVQIFFSFGGISAALDV